MNKHAKLKEPSDILTSLLDFAEIKDADLDKCSKGMPINDIELSQDHLDGNSGIIIETQVKWAFIPQKPEYILGLDVNPRKNINKENDSSQ